MLKRLLRIKVLREQGAALEVRRQRHRWELAVAEQTRREQALADFRAWRPGHEERLFARLADQLVAMMILEAYREDLAELITREAALQQALLAAEKACLEVRAALAKAEQAHRTAIREVEKFTELDREAQILVVREQERAEDQELEEFATPVKRRRAA
ncbi:type III secretion protein O [Gammaproteobacteria bacterium]